MGKKKTKPTLALPRKPEDIRQEWANTGVLLADQERIKVLCQRQFEQAQKRLKQIHSKMDELDSEMNRSSEYYKNADKNSEVSP